MMIIGGFQQKAYLASWSPYRSPPFTILSYLQQYPFLSMYILTIHIYRIYEVFIKLK